MSVDVAHLVLKSLGDTDDKVIDQRLDCSECCDILASTMVELNVDRVGVGSRKADGEMGEVLL